MSAQADSLFSLGPIVAAPHVSVPLVSERSGDSAVCYILSFSEFIVVTYLLL